jgi:putative membrane protein
MDMSPFIVRWLCTTLAVAVAAWITGIHYTSPAWLFVAALLLGFVNAFVRPVLLLLSLPFIVVTLGAFILIVNTLLFWLVSGLVPHFEVSGFWQAFFAALIVSIVNWVLSLFVRSNDGSVHIITQQGREKAITGRVIEQ